MFKGGAHAPFTEFTCRFHVLFFLALVTQWRRTDHARGLRKRRPQLFVVESCKLPFHSRLLCINGERLTPSAAHHGHNVFSQAGEEPKEGELKSKD